MKPLHIIFITLALLLVAAALYFWPRAAASTNVTNYPSQGADIIAFGDSLVAGYGSSQPGGFVSMLAQDIGEPIVNLGQDGDTTQGALGRVKELNKYNPNVVILLVGGNDFLNKLDMTVAFANLGQIIEDIQNRGAVVLLVGVRVSSIIGNYDSQFEALANTYHTAYVPHVMDGILGNSSLMYDNVHPNDAGYKLISQRILPTLEPLVR